MNQLKWNPLLTASEIGVSVNSGIVTLSGQVDAYYKKLEAEQEAKKIAGVKAIAEDIHVGVSPRHKRTDAEIAAAVLNALKWDTSIPEDHIRVKVEDGVVTLEGEVEWVFQLQSAARAAGRLAGVRKVINSIALRPKVAPSDLKHKISAAFIRNATIDASRIQVEVTGSKVVLTGRVRSLTEKEDAEKAAWLAPGIQFVENNLEVEHEPEPSKA